MFVKISGGFFIRLLCRILYKLKKFIFNLIKGKKEHFSLHLEHHFFNIHK